MNQFCKRLKTRLVLNLVYKGFLRISIPPLISIFHAKEGVSRFSFEKFSSHSDEQNLLGTLGVSENFEYRKSLRIGKGGYHNFLSIFLSHKIEIFRRVILLCFKKVLVSKNCMDKRGMKGKITIFRRKIFQSTEKTIGKPVCVSENFEYRKSLRIGKGGYHNFLSIFLSHKIEIFRRVILLCFKKVLVSKNCMDKRGMKGKITIFRRKIFQSTEKTIGKPVCVSEKILCRKISQITVRGREYHNFPLKKICLTAPNENCRGTLRGLRKI